MPSRPECPFSSQATFAKLTLDFRAKTSQKEIK